MASRLSGSGAAAAAAPLGLVNLDPAVVPLIVKGAASQSAVLQQWQNSAGTVLATVDATGLINAANFVSAGQISVGSSTAGAAYCNVSTSGNPGVIGAIIKGSASQSADLQQWQSSTSSVLAKVDSSGAVAPQNGARLCSGSGAPTTPGGLNPTAGDLYIRTDVPGTANSRLYMCSVGGATPTWVALV